MNRMLCRTTALLAAMSLGCGVSVEDEPIGNANAATPLQSSELVDVDKDPDFTLASCGTPIEKYSCRIGWTYYEPRCPGGIGHGFDTYTQMVFRTATGSYVYQLWGPDGSVNTGCTANPNTCKQTNCWG